MGALLDGGVMEPAELILEEPAVASELTNEDTEWGADGRLFKPKNKNSCYICH